MSITGNVEVVNKFFYTEKTIGQNIMKAKREKTTEKNVWNLYHKQMNKKEMNNLLFAKLYEQKFHRKNGTNASIMYEKMLITREI